MILFKESRGQEKFCAIKAARSSAAGTGVSTGDRHKEAKGSWPKTGGQLNPELKGVVPIWTSFASTSL